MRCRARTRVSRRLAAFGAAIAHPVSTPFERLGDATLASRRASEERPRRARASGRVSAPASVLLRGRGVEERSLRDGTKRGMFGMRAVSCASVSGVVKTCELI